MEFHRSPAVKMLYHFLLYIFFLLAFSYMMLFHMRSPNEKIHWTKVYVIITVSAMLIEDIREFLLEYIHQMSECWQHRNIGELISILVGKFLTHVTPYILFYTGIGLMFFGSDEPHIFSEARIVLAIDLECSLTSYDSVNFTARGIAEAIYFRPYWWLYSIDNDEVKNLMNTAQSDTSSTDQVSEAIVHHILLAFHMIFINILILNLLISVFGHEIDEVKENDKFYWHRQRYRMVREYYEKPALAYPPLSLFVYIKLLIKKIVMKMKKRNKALFRTFKLEIENFHGITDDGFESEATYKYARSVVELKYRKHLQSAKKPKAIVEQVALGVHMVGKLMSLNPKNTTA
ncbi:unnamed protein product [Rotaria sordida]|uniref:Ion transport domain-containing protein n=1 Tax=Rotaria sordida TaxID=392033 RepID=A0A814VB86_9BILA|nr:unnamed protein product [Rotaria sordida]